MKEVLKIISICFLVCIFVIAKGQININSPYLITHDFKTPNLVPKNADHKVNNIIVFQPIVEYRFYNATFYKTIHDSDFTSKLLQIKNNYVIFPFKQKITQNYFSWQCRRVLKKYSDTTVPLPLNIDTVTFIKAELDSINLLAEKEGLNEYKISTRLLNFLSQYKATQFVFSNILVYQTPGHPSQYIKSTFFVFDVLKKELFYYKNLIQYHNYSMSNTDERYGYFYLQDVFVLKQTLRNYKKYLKPYIKYTKPLF